MSLRIVHYLNQFFGQKGGEEAAGFPIEAFDGAVAVGGQIQNLLKGQGEIVQTIICGDDYANENVDKVTAKIKEILTATKPDLLIAGPAFNAGRYGMACGQAAKVASELGIPVISGMYEENPGYELYRPFMFTIGTGNSAASMRQALPDMVKLVEAFIQKGANGLDPKEDGYMPRVIRINTFAEKRGAERAVAMLVRKLKGEVIETEYPMPVFDRVEPQPAIKDMAHATIALVTSGGVVPHGNPNRIEASSASKYGEYSLVGVDTLTPEGYETAHGGYDPVACNQDPNRVLPVDVLREMEKEGRIGKLYELFYTTVGNGTSVSNAKKFGAAIAQKLKDAGVSAAILTST